MTGSVWIDLQMSLAEIEAEISDIPDELLRIPTVGNAMGQRRLKGAIDNALNLNRISGRSGVCALEADPSDPEQVSPAALTARAVVNGAGGGDNEGMARGRGRRLLIGHCADVRRA